MTYEEAIKILDPATTRDALVEEACRMAVEALKGEQK